MKKVKQLQLFYISYRKGIHIQTSRQATKTIHCPQDESEKCISPSKTFEDEKSQILHTLEGFTLVLEFNWLELHPNAKPHYI